MQHIINIAIITIYLSTFKYIVFTRFVPHHQIVPHCGAIRRVLSLFLEIILIVPHYLDGHETTEIPKYYLVYWLCTSQVLVSCPDRFLSHKRKKAVWARDYSNVACLNDNCLDKTNLLHRKVSCNEL